LTDHVALAEPVPDQDAFPRFLLAQVLQSQVAHNPEISPAA
jgi:hypothetical protein